MRATIALLGLSICGVAVADYDERQQARTAIAFVRIAPTICKSLRADPGATAAIMGRLSQQDVADVIGYGASLDTISKTVHGLMQTGDEANACKMARDFEKKTGLKLFAP